MSARKTGGKRVPQESLSTLARRVMRSHGVQTMAFSDGSFGMLRVPKKWGGLISDLIAAFDLREKGETVVLRGEVDGAPAEKEAVRP